MVHVPMELEDLVLENVARITHCTIVHQGVGSHGTRPVSIMRRARDCHRPGSRLCKDDAGIIQANIAGGTARCRVQHWAVDGPRRGRDLEGCIGNNPIPCMGE